MNINMYNTKLNWATWVCFGMSWLLMLVGNQYNGYSEIGLWLMMVFVLSVIMQKLNNMTKDLNRKIDDYVHCQVESTRRQKK